MSHKTHGIGGYLVIFTALIGLTALTVYTASLNFGSWNLPVALVIASTKAVLVILFFMHVIESDGLTRFLIVASVIWLLLLLGVTFSDYISRGWGSFNLDHSWIPKIS